MKNLHRGISLALLAGVAFTIAGCSKHAAPPWAERNQAVMDEHKISGRSRDLPEVNVPMALTDGEPVLAADLPAANLAPGVEAKLSWGRGALLEHVTMAPGAEYPAQTLGEELIIVVTAGSATLDLDGRTLDLAKDSAVYLTPGNIRSMKAGPEGLQTFEVYSPVRLDHLALAGQDVSKAKPGFPDMGVTPSLEPGVVVNINEIQWTPLTDPAADSIIRAAPRRRASSGAAMPRSAWCGWTRAPPLRSTSIPRISSATPSAARSSRV